MWQIMIVYAVLLHNYSDEAGSVEECLVICACELHKLHFNTRIVTGSQTEN